MMDFVKALSGSNIGASTGDLVFICIAAAILIIVTIAAIWNATMDTSAMVGNDAANMDVRQRN